MRVFYTREFEHEFKKAGLKLQAKINNRIDILLDDGHHPLLKDHPLHGKYQGKRSISITGDWRVIYYIEGFTIIFFRLGRHTDLY